MEDLDSRRPRGGKHREAFPAGVGTQEAHLARAGIDDEEEASLLAAAGLVDADQRGLLDAGAVEGAFEGERKLGIRQRIGAALVEQARREQLAGELGRL